MYNLNIGGLRASPTAQIYNLSLRPVSTKTLRRVYHSSTTQYSLPRITCVALREGRLTFDLDLKRELLSGVMF